MQKKSVSRLAVLFCLLVLVAVYIWQVHYFSHYVNDDAYITFRYSRHLAEGAGPYFNVGEHVEGYTNFSLMVIVAIVIRCFGPESAPMAAKLLGSLWGTGVVLLTYGLFRRLFRPVWRNRPQYIVTTGALMAAGIVAVTPAFALNSISGLETSMFSFFIMLGVFMDTLSRCRRKWLYAAAAFCLAGLTRPEGFLLFAVYWATGVSLLTFSIIRNQRKFSIPELMQRVYASKSFRLRVWTALAVTGIFIGHVAFRFFLYDGEFLPNTYYAKQGGFLGGTASRYIFNGLLFPVFGGAGLVISLAGYGLSRSRLSRHVLSLAVLAITCGCLPFITGIDWMPGWRLVIPYLPLVAIIVTGGWIGFSFRVAGIRLWMAAVIVTVSLTLLWFRHDTSRRLFYDETAMRAHGYQTGHSALAAWLKAETEKGDTVVLMDTGIVGYLCSEQRILDITGLTDRFIAKSKGGFLSKCYDPDYIFNSRPKFVVLTITAPGYAYQEPSPETTFNFWTPIEMKLFQTPEFEQHYLKKRSPPVSATNWLDSFACNIGAEKIFEHAHPGRYYLLAVFRRNDELPVP